ncbi:hypothetical protein AMS68_004152 [Peltaster fructicola]|uniref:Histone H4 n=1 Tax=Peltaster fructicola TaxID=286661 RepID=A0A6H0XVF2_9PEZI|nr:hypothetical protein AMS68_004152 [Peltaster fructicola]
MNTSNRSTGLGRGRALPRHRKILRDNIHGVTKASIRKLARRGGVKRISCTIYDHTREVLKQWLQSLIRDIVLYVDHAGRRTVMTSDVVHALRRRGTPIYGFHPIRGTKHF